jgi:hypothetical protein
VYWARPSMNEPHQRLRKLGAGEHVSKRSSGQPRCNGRLNQVIGMEDGLWVTINKVNQCEERQWEKQHCQDASEPIKDIPQSSSHCPLLGEKSPTRLLVTSGTEVAPPEQAEPVTPATCRC